MKDKRRLYYNPKQAFVLQIVDDSSLSVLWFTYESNYEEQFWITSGIEKVEENDHGFRVTTHNSIYELSIDELHRQKISIEEYLYCRKGYSPYEARQLHKLRK